MNPASCLLEAEKLEAYADKLIGQRDALEKGRSYLGSYITLTRSIETAQANAARYRAKAQQQEAK